MVFALIENGIVTNTIIADNAFVSSIENNFDHIVQIDELDPRPSISWTYDENTEQFTDPS